VSIIRPNPNHPVIQQLEEHWPKLCALLLAKFGPGLGIAVEITTADIAKVDGTAVVVDARGGALTLMLVPIEEGIAMAKTQPGQPI
jgi:hypothetical protein